MHPAPRHLPGIFFQPGEVGFRVGDCTVLIVDEPGHGSLAKFDRLKTDHYTRSPALNRNSGNHSRTRIPEGKTFYEGETFYKDGFRSRLLDGDELQTLKVVLEKRREFYRKKDFVKRWHLRSGDDLIEVMRAFVAGAEETPAHTDTVFRASFENVPKNITVVEEKLQCELRRVVDLEGFSQWKLSQVYFGGDRGVQDGIFLEGNGIVAVTRRREGVKEEADHQPPRAG